MHPLWSGRLAASDRVFDPTQASGFFFHQGAKKSAQAVAGDSPLVASLIASEECFAIERNETACRSIYQSIFHRCPQCIESKSFSQQTVVFARCSLWPPDRGRISASRAHRLGCIARHRLGQGPRSPFRKSQTRGGTHRLGAEAQCAAQNHARGEQAAASQAHRGHRSGWADAAGAPAPASGRRNPENPAAFSHLQECRQYTRCRVGKESGRRLDAGGGRRHRAPHGLAPSPEIYQSSPGRKGVEFSYPALSTTRTFRRYQNPSVAPDSASDRPPRFHLLFRTRQSGRQSFGNQPDRPEGVVGGLHSFHHDQAP